jgi:fructose-1,6-bisphosphatase/inositol monophosphatase family enzyme
MNEQHRSVATPSKAEIVFSVTSGVVSTGVQVGGAAVVGAAAGLVKGLSWLARKGAKAVAESQPYQKAVAKATDAWESASQAAHQQAEEESRQLREEAEQA